MNYVIIIGIILAIAFVVFIVIYISCEKGKLKPTPPTPKPKPKPTPPTPTPTPIPTDVPMYMKVYKLDVKTDKYVFLATADMLLDHTFSCGYLLFGLGGESQGCKLELVKYIPWEGNYLRYGSDYIFTINIWYGNPPHKQIIDLSNCDKERFGIFTTTHPHAVFYAQTPSGKENGDIIYMDDVFVLKTETYNISYDKYSYQPEDPPILMTLTQSVKAPYSVKFSKDIG